jgi:transposase
MDNGGQVIHIPEFVVRQVGLLQLQLAAANEEIHRLTAEIAALKAVAAPADSAVSLSDPGIGLG